MKCPVCNLDQARGQRSAETLDAVDIECIGCGRYTITGPEELDLAGLTNPERERLSGQLRKANLAGEPLSLSHGFARRVLERDWTVAPRARYPRRSAPADSGGASS